MVRSILAGGKWIRRAIWIWPIIAAVMLGTVGWFLRGAVESKLREQLADQLNTVLDADVTALKLWMKSQETAAASVAASPTILEQTEKLIAVAARPEVTQLELLQTPELKALRAELDPILETGGYAGWVIVDRSQRIIASKRNEVVGIPNPRGDVPYAAKALAGLPTVSAPRKSLALLPDKDGELKSGLPTMFAWAPVRNSGGEVVATLALRIDPDQDFSRILGVAQCGQTGETYAVNREGLMISQSRFNEELRTIGLLREDEDATLNISMRNPGVDLSRGQRPRVVRSEQPLTVPAATIAAAESGLNLTGYLDYRGAPSVGAWRWLPEYELGVITEQNSAEAFAVIELLRIVFWGMFTLLAAASVAIFVATLALARLNRQAQEAALEAKQLGQYTLDKKLGEGGMGVVYKAHHAMLHRPTAVKFLNVDKTNELTVARFEREVQLTSRLTHPNTISVYDYGRTPEGIFYYAMEYLEGTNLDDLVLRYGPLPEARVIHLLAQVCGSLAEAHGIGLIHRDIKPANIILTQRGGIFDFVKLLDFGLVKAVDEGRQAKLTAAGSTAGTPLYLSPEAIEDPDGVDARSDLYAVGAVGYFLLTGTPPFDGKNVIEILQKHLNAAVDRPTTRLARPVAEELEALLLQALAKKPEDRPQSAREMFDALSRLALRHPWTQAEAALCFTAPGRIAVATTCESPTKSAVISATMEVDASLRSKTGERRP